MKIRIISSMFLIYSLMLTGCISSGSFTIESSSMDIYSTEKELQTSIQMETSSIDNSIAETCTSANEQTTESTSNEQTIDTSETESYLNNKISINWVYNDMVTLSNETEKRINNRLDELGKEYYISFKKVPEVGFESYINSNMGTEKSPDIISAGVGPTGNYTGTYRAYRDNWLIDLKGYFESPEGEKLWDAVPEKCWEACDVNGSYIGISTVLPTSTTYAYYVNTDMMDSMGITAENIKEATAEDFLHYFSLIDDEECRPLIFSGSGFDIIDGLSAFVEIRNIQSCAIVYDKQLSKVINLFENQEAIDTFKLIRETSSNSSKVCSSFFIYKGAINLLNSSLEDMVVDELKGKYTGVNEITVIPYGDIILQNNFNAITGVCQASCKQEDALDALTTVMTDKVISDLLLYGVEGIDYSVNAEGEVETDAFAWAFSMYFGNTFIATKKSGDADNLKKIYEDLDNSSVLLGKYIELGIYKEKIAEIEKTVNEYSGLLKGEYEDIEGTVAEINEKLKKIGIDEIITYINSQLDAEY